MIIEFSDCLFHRIPMWCLAHDLKKNPKRAALVLQSTVGMLLCKHKSLSMGSWFVRVGVWLPSTYSRTESSSLSPPDGTVLLRWLVLDQLSVWVSQLVHYQCVLIICTGPNWEPTNFCPSFNTFYSECSC